MLHERLVQGASEFPDTSCIVEAETGRTLTYAECLAAVQALRRLVGAEPHAVIMALPSGTTSALVWLGALSGGHTLLPLPPAAGAAERRRAVQLARPHLLILERWEDAERFGCPHARIVTRQECERVIDAAVEQVRAYAASAAGRVWAPHEGRVCLMTSGSTGEPKGVFLSERQIAWTADHIRRSHHLTAADRGLTVLPLFHVNAPVVSLCTSILAGGAVVIARRFSRSWFWQWIERYQITWASMVPTILAMLLETEKPAFLPGKLRFVRTASAPLPVVHLRAFEHRFAVPVVETYGLSEAAATVAANPVPPGRRKPGSVGLPVGVELRVCRSRAGAEAEPLVDVAQGEPGEICVRGPSVVSSYAGGASAPVFQDGWFRTGDLGYQDTDGYLYITGRLRDVIIRGGENIAPREIEEVLLADPLVRDVAVVGRPDPLYGQQVVAYVVLKEPWSAEREQTLRARCAESLSAYKIPQTFVPVARLPRTRSGKIQRHRLSTLPGLSGLSVLSAMLSGSKLGQSVADGVSATVASTVTSTLARIQRIRQARHQYQVARPVKLAVESSSHHYVVRVTAPPRPAVSARPQAMQSGSAGQTTPLAVIHAATNTLPDRASYSVAGQGRGAPVPADRERGGLRSAQTQSSSPRAASMRQGKTRRPYVYELDPIRVVTALSVVGVHVMTFAMVLNSSALGAQVQIGLGSTLHFTREVFMFATAFVLVYSYAGSSFDLTTFWRKRGSAVVLPYVVWSLIYLWLNRPPQPPAQLTLAVVKAVLSGNGSYQLYYILLTIQFYMLFPLLLVALPWIRRHQWLVLVASGALELVVLGLDYVYLQTPPLVNTPWGSLLDTYQDRFVLVYQFYFLLGAVVAFNVERVRAFVRRHAGLIVIAMAVALALYWLNYAIGVWGLHQPVEYASSVLQPELVPYSLAVLAFLGWLACRWAARRGATGQPRGARFWRTMAEASFGIYLVHPLILTLVLRTVAPALPPVLPVALRIGLIWLFVASGSAALSILLMKTPVLSRLVGRATPLPSAPVLGARSGGTRKPRRTQQTLQQQTAHAARRRRVEPAARDADLRPATTAPLPVAARQAPREADASLSRAVTATDGSLRAMAGERPARASAPKYPNYTNPRVVTVHLDDWPRVTRPLPAVEHPAGKRPARARITIDFRNGWTGKEDADELRSAQASAPQQAPGTHGLRDERRRRAWELRQQGWKQKDIAAELGVSPSTVSGWLRRERDDELAAPDAAPDESADVESSVPRVQRAVMTHSRSRA